MIPWWSAPALAHTAGLSRLRIERDRVELVLAEPELAERYPMADLDRVSGLLVEDTWDRLSLAVDGHPCALDAPTVSRVDDDGVALIGALRCPEGQPWTVRVGHPELLTPGHRVEVEVGDRPAAVLTAQRPEATVDAAPASGSTAPAFFTLGVEHIVTGWDHLAFLAALLLVARSWRQAAATVTGFTVAHSVTLGAMTLGWVSAPARIVEPAIALTIVAVALENLLDPPPIRRFVATTLLGLIHGFGFAGMLADLGLPPAAAIPALVAFNLGVEVGQLVIVAALLALLLPLRRRPGWVERGVPALSIGLALLGLGWFAARV